MVWNLHFQSYGGKRVNWKCNHNKTKYTKTFYIWYGIFGTGNLVYTHVRTSDNFICDVHVIANHALTAVLVITNARPNFRGALAKPQAKLGHGRINK